MKAEFAQESVSKSADWNILQISDLNNPRKGYVMMTYPFYYGLISFFHIYYKSRNERIFNIMSKQNITKK